MLQNDLKVVIAGVDVPYVNVTVQGAAASISITAVDIRGDLKEMVKYEAVPVMILARNSDPAENAIIDPENPITTEHIIIFEGLSSDISVHKVAYSNMVNILVRARRLSNAILDDIRYTDISVNKAFATVPDTQTFELRKNMAQATGNEKMLVVPDGIFSPSASDIFLRKLITGDKVVRISKPHHMYQYTLDNMLLPMQAEFRFTGDVHDDIRPYTQLDSELINLFLSNDDRKKLNEQRKYDADMEISDSDATKLLNPNLYTALLDTLPGFSYSGANTEGQRILNNILELVNIVSNKTKYSNTDYSSMVADYVTDLGGSSVASILSTELKTSYNDMQRVLDENKWKLQVLNNVIPADNSKAIQAYLNNTDNIFYRQRALYRQYLYSALYMLCSMLGTTYLERTTPRSGGMTPIKKVPVSRIFSDINDNPFEIIFTEDKNSIDMIKLTFRQMSFPLFMGILSYLENVMLLLDKYFMINSASLMKQFIDARLSKVAKPETDSTIKLIDQLYDYMSGTNGINQLAPASRTYNRVIEKVTQMYANTPDYTAPKEKDIVHVTGYRRLLLDQLNKYLSSGSYVLLQKMQTAASSFHELFYKENTVNNNSYFGTLIAEFNNIARASDADTESFIRAIAIGMHNSIMEELVVLVNSTFEAIVTSLNDGLSQSVTFYNSNYKVDNKIDVRLVIPVIISGNAEDLKRILTTDSLPELNRSVAKLIDFLKKAGYDNSEAKLPTNFSVFDYKAARNIHNYGLTRRWGSFDSLIRYDYYNSSSIFPTLKLQNFIEYQKMINNALQSGSSTFSLSTALGRMYSGMYYALTTPLNMPVFYNYSIIDNPVRVHPDIFLKPGMNMMFIPPKCNIMLIEDRDKHLSFNKATNVDKVIINHHQALEMLAGVPSSEFYVMDIFQTDSNGPVTATQYNEYLRSITTSSGLYITGKNLFDLETHTTLDIAPQIDMLKRIKDKTTIDDLLSYSSEKDIFPEVGKSDIEDVFSINNMLIDGSEGESDSYLYSKVKTLQVNFNIIDDPDFKSASLPPSVTSSDYRNRISKYLELTTYPTHLNKTGFFKSNKIKKLTYDNYKKNIKNSININYSRVLTAGFPNELSVFNEISKKQLLNKYRIIGTKASNDFEDDYEAFKLKYANNPAELKRIEKEYTELLAKNKDIIDSGTEVFTQFKRTAAYIVNGKEVFDGNDNEIEQAFKQSISSIKEGTLPFNINMFLYILLNHIQGAAYKISVPESDKRSDSVLKAIGDLQFSGNTKLLISLLGDAYFRVLDDTLNYFINMLVTILLAEYVQTKLDKDALKQKLFYFITNIMMTDKCAFFSSLNYNVTGNDPDDFKITLDVKNMKAGYVDRLKSLLEDPEIAKTVVDYKTGSDKAELTDLLQKFIDYMDTASSERSIQVTGLYNMYNVMVTSCFTDDMAKDKSRGKLFNYPNSVISNKKNTGATLSDDDEKIGNYTGTVTSHLYMDTVTSNIYRSIKSQYRGFLKSSPSLMLTKTDNIISSNVVIMDPSVTGDNYYIGSTRAGLSLTLNNSLYSAVNGGIDISGTTPGPLEITPKFFTALQKPLNTNVLDIINKGKKVDGLIGLPTGGTNDVSERSSTAGSYFTGQNYVLINNIDYITDYIFCRGLYTNFKYNVCGATISKSGKRLVKMLYSLKPSLMSSKLPQKLDTGDGSTFESAVYSPVVTAMDYYKNLTFPVITNKDKCVITSEFLNLRSKYADIHTGNDYGFDASMSDQYIKDGVALAALSDGWITLGLQSTDEKVSKLSGFGMYVLFMPDMSITAGSLPITTKTLVTPLYIYAHCDIYRTLQIIYDRYKNNDDDEYATLVSALKEIFDNSTSNSTLKKLSDFANSREYNATTLSGSDYQQFIKPTGTLQKLFSKLDNFRVKVVNGDTIAYMGSSGGSAGPHLHLQALKTEVPLTSFSKGVSGGELRNWYRTCISNVHAVKNSFKAEVSATQYEYYKSNQGNSEVRRWKNNFRNVIFDDRVLALLGNRPSTYSTMTDGVITALDQRDMPVYELLNLEADYSTSITKADFSGTIDAIRFYVQGKLLDSLFNVKISPITLPYHDPYFVDGGMPFAIIYTNDIVFTNLVTMQTTSNPASVSQQLVFENGISLRYMLYYYIRFIKLQRKTNKERSDNFNYSQMPMFPFSILREYNQTLMNMETMNSDYFNMFGRKNFAFNWMEHTYIKNGSNMVKFSSILSDKSAFDRFIDTFDPVSLILDRNNDTILISFSSFYLAQDTGPASNPVTTSNLHGEDLLSFRYRRWNSDNVYTLKEWSKNFKYSGVIPSSDLRNGIVFRPGASHSYHSSSNQPYYKSVLDGMDSVVSNWKESGILYQDWFNIFLNIRNSFKA